MTAPFDDMLNSPALSTPTGLTVGLSPQQRLDMAMRRANERDPSDIPEPGNWSSSTAGVPNPYGQGVHAYEPNNVLFDAYRTAKGEYDQKKFEEEEAAKAAAALTGGGAGPGGAIGGTPLIEGTGKVSTAIRNALALAARRVPYVWGGSSANAVDCSGLLYYAFSSAGLDVKRWRAVDYANMGIAVTIDQARPGDVVYYDNPGTTTDHVGIYIGNGQVVQAPQTGDVVKVTGVGRATSIRRIFDDTAFGTVATPGGGTAVSYGGSTYNPSVGSTRPSINTAAALGSTITRQPARRVGGPQEF